MRRAGDSIRSALAAQSRRRRIFWAIVAAILVAVPLAVNLARQTSFPATLTIFPRTVGPIPAERGPLYYRSLVLDPELRLQMQRLVGADDSDYRRVRIERRRAAIAVTFSDPDRVRARDFVNQLGGQMANATSRRLGALATQRAARLTRLARREKRRSTAARLRRQAAGWSSIARAPPQRFVIARFAREPKLTRFADRLVDALPGAVPPRPNAAIAALASLLTLVGLFVLSLFVFPPGGRRAVAATAPAAAPYAPPRARAPAAAPPVAHPPAREAESVWSGSPGETSIWTTGPEFDDALERTTGIDRRVAVGVFALLCLAAGALVVLWAHETFFWGADWDMVLRRFGLSKDTLLTPHVNHLVATQVLFYEAVRALADWHYGAYRAGLELLQLAIAVGVFVFARPRLGGWLAAALVVPLLFVPGEATAVYTVGHVIAVLTGLAAILVLDRVPAGIGRDVAVCLLLLLSIASFSFGLAFCVAVAIWFLATPGQRRSLWVPAIPILAYVVWVASYHPPSPLSLHNLADTPDFVADSAAAAFATVTGLGLGWGRLLALAAAVGVGYELFTKPRLRTPMTYAIVALPVLLWTIVGLGRAASGGTGAEAAAGTDPLLQRLARLNDAVVAGQSRYVYASVVLLLLVAAHLLSGRRLRAWVGVAAVLVLVGVVTNLVVLRDTGDQLRARAEQVRARIAAVELARKTIPRDFSVESLPGGTAGNLDFVANFQQAAFADAVRRVGSEPVPLRQLRLGAAGRRDLDAVLVAALPVTLAPAPPGTRAGECTTVAAGAPPAPRDAVRTLVRAGRAPAAISLRRFGGPRAVQQVGTVPAGGTSILTIPRDRSRRRWTVGVSSDTPTRLCAPRAPA